ncbi:CHAT domain-containing protein [Actinomycetospora chibensis]|uniref:CHAT domain-containing protein n=1 Tax=Actinomycetospora chibensis TaxID=663606 RepID=A0ABV9RGC5_9PSEU|nr:CHAT domain-containing protein [Actinomycetospora chibensis]MDD7927612.1 CHAT domain-containing protein [Actinomycetospora chibensis]
MEFDELRVRLRRIGTARYLALVNGSAQAATVLPIGEEPAQLRAEFGQLLNIEVGAEPAGPTDVGERLRSLGRAIFDLLFDEALRGCLNKALNAAQARSQGLRLRFDLPPELADLPLEALRSSPDRAEQTLALNASLSVARSVAGETSGQRLPTADEPPDFIHLLVAVASPAERSLTPLDASREMEALHAALPDLAVRIDVMEHTTRRALASWLSSHSDRPTAVLLIAHGRYDEERAEGLVLLEAEDGTTDEVSGHLLSGILIRAQRLRLVVLNLCFGARSSAAEPFSGLAQSLIGRGLPAVVGMNGLVTDRAAATFGPRLLEGLCINRTIDEAMTAARQHIVDMPRHTRVEWVTPTLFLHGACGHGWLFKARQVHDTDDEVHDFLRQGAHAVAQLEKPGNVKRAVALAAARYKLACYDWAGVQRLVSGLGAHPEAAFLLTQANLELAWSGVERLCAVLAAEDGTDKATAALDAVRARLPGQLAQRLDEEIRGAHRCEEFVTRAAQAVESADWAAAVAAYAQVLDERPAGFRDVSERLAASRAELTLAQQYTAAQEHATAGEWTAMLAALNELLNRRPEGYRDSAEWAAYARGRCEEAADNWVAAEAAYRECHALDDAPARAAYARGRVAAAADDWAAADTAFVTACEHGTAPDEWIGYARARAAEDGGLWDAAESGYVALDDFRDSRERAVFVGGRAAADAGDMARALVAYRALLAMGWHIATLVEETGAALRAQVQAAEAARDWPRVVALLDALADDAVADRRHYAAARVAEAAEDWPVAAERYAACGYADGNHRARYAAGRMAEDDGRWDDAHQEYAALPASLLDVRARRWWTAGRDADARGDWSGVVRGFDELPDTFAGGEVKRHRSFARARLAAESGDWRSVLSQLGDALDGARDGQVGLLRTWARGHLAEEAEDWAGAVEIYRGEPGAPEMAEALAYAEARLHESRADWAAALRAYRKLPDGHRDGATRAGYCAARILELDLESADGGDGEDEWARVVDAYAELPPEFADVAARSAYARLRSALHRRDWVGAADLPADVAGYRDTRVLAAYANGRVAEQAEEWAEALAAYTESGDHADGPARRAYIEGRCNEQDGRWSAAVSAYRRAGVVADAAARRHRLAALLAELPWADELAGTELAPDPIAVADPTFPYRALRSVGVTPASSTETVKNATYALMEQGGISGPERVAWDQLRTPARRLVVDAQLYTFHDGAGLARDLNALEPADGSVLLARLCERLPEDAPLLTLLAGHRAEAVAAWQSRLAAAPCDVAVAHRLAITSAWRAQDQEASGAWEQAERTWRTALTCWAVVLTDDEHWVGWRQNRAARYGQAITPADTTRMRAALGAHLMAVLTRHGERHAAAGRPEQERRYEALVAFFEAELEAAQVLKEAGGLPLGDDEANRLACGAAYLRFVDLVGALGRFVAAADPLPGDKPLAGDRQVDEAVMRRLRQLFSELCTASLLAEQHRYQAALDALPSFHRNRLVELPPDCAGPASSAHESDGGCPACGAFLDRNPAYTYLPGRWARLQHDAVDLAVRAHLFIARGLLTERRRFPEAMTRLAGAIRLSANAAITVRTRTAALGMVLGRVSALEQGRLAIDRLDEAVALVELAQPVVGAPGREQLTAKLASLLVSRGVWYGSSCRNVGIEPDMGRAIVDLRRALELRPGSARARDNLARALMYDPTPRRPAERLPHLVEALAIVNEGLRQAEASTLLRECLLNVLDEIESLVLAELSVAELATLVSADNTTDDDPDPDPDPDPAAARARGVHDLVKAVRGVRAEPLDATRRAALLRRLRTRVREIS